jgi:dTDP-4-dehydrorhamnose reductase
MRVLIFGAGGMLGHKLLQVLSGDESLEVYGAVRNGSIVRILAEFNAKFFTDVEAENFELIKGIVFGLGPEVIINAVGVVKQTPEAASVEKCLQVNSIFPHKLAKLALAVGARFVTFSTDCVFSGKKGRYREEDFADAEDLYGRSKLLGEVKGSNCLTIRTSIIGRELKDRKGLIEWFLSQEGRKIRGYKKAIFSGFPTVVLAGIIRDLLRRDVFLEGVYHVSSNAISKYELLCLIREKLGLKIDIEPDETVCIDRSLDSTKFRQATDFQPESWERMIERMLEDFKWYKEVER